MIIDGNHIQIAFFNSHCCLDKNSRRSSKTWVTQTGQKRPGKPIDKSLIYKILHNRTYLGEIRHKDKWYPGVHEAIITQDLWNKCQAILTKNHRTRGNHTRAKANFLLRGLVFAPDGRAFTTWSSVPKKNGRSYRYYVNTRENKEYAGASKLPRLPAKELEALVTNQIRTLLQTPPLITKTTTATKTLGEHLDEAQVTIALNQIDKIWEQLFINEQIRIVNLLIEKIIIMPDNIDIRLHKNGIEKLALEIISQQQAS